MITQRTWEMGIVTQKLWPWIEEVLLRGVLAIGDIFLITLDTRFVRQRPTREEGTNF